MKKALHSFYLLSYSFRLFLFIRSDKIRAHIKTIAICFVNEKGIIIYWQQARWSTNLMRRLNTLVICGGGRSGGPMFSTSLDFFFVFFSSMPTPQYFTVYLEQSTNNKRNLVMFCLSEWMEERHTTWKSPGTNRKRKERLRKQTID